MVVAQPGFIGPQPSYVGSTIVGSPYGVPAYEDPRAPHMIEVPPYGPQVQYVMPQPTATAVEVREPVRHTTVAEDAHGVKYV